MRRVVSIALPAFIASRGECRWLGSILADAIRSVGIGPRDLMSAFDDETSIASATFDSALTANGVEQCRDAIEKKAARRRTSDVALRHVHSYRA